MVFLIVWFSFSFVAVQLILPVFFNISWHSYLFLLPFFDLSLEKKICLNCVMTDELFNITYAYLNWYLWIKVFHGMNRKIETNDENERDTQKSNRRTKGKRMKKIFEMKETKQYPTSQSTWDDESQIERTTGRIYVYWKKKRTYEQDEGEGNNHTVELWGNCTKLHRVSSRERKEESEN